MWWTLAVACKARCKGHDGSFALSAVNSVGDPEVACRGTRGCVVDMKPEQEDGDIITGGDRANNPRRRMKSYIPDEAAESRGDARSEEEALLAR